MRNITFTAQNESQELIERLIQTGQYKNEGDAINAALKLLKGQETAKLQHLRALIDEGIKSGPAEEVDEDQFLQELKAS